MSFECFKIVLLLMVTTAFGQSGAVRIAGRDPASTSVGDGGPATLARLEYPTSVAVDTSGNLYIADEGLLRIRKVGTDGVISTVAGTGSSQSGPDGAPAVSTAVLPYGVAVDSRGTVYFADSRALVRKIAPDGTLATVAGFTGTGLGSGDGGPATAAKITPWGIAIDRSNNLYIADAASARVRKVTPDGIIHTVAGTGQPGAQGEGGPAALAQLQAPRYVAVDTAGSLYIADQDRILRVTGDGILTRIAGGGATRMDGVPATSSLISTAGIAVDSLGNVYTADSAGNTIRKISTDGIIHTIAGTGRQGSSDGCGNALAAQFYAPEGVAVDAAGNVYTGERGNPRVRQVSPGGSIRTVAGPGSESFGGDGGAATLAAISSPSGLAFDTAGTLYLADTANNRIRAITPAGIIMTVAGSGPTAGDFSGCVLPPGPLNRPAAVAAGANNEVYIADTGNDRVMVLSKGLGLSVFAGTGAKGSSGDGGPATAATLNGPAGLAVDSAGDVYIADTGNNRLRVVGRDGGIRSVPANFSAPSGLAFDGDGNLYVAESQGHRVTRMKPDGTMDRFAGTGVSTASIAPIPTPQEELANPTGVAIDPFRTLYVADSGSVGGKLQRITRNGALSNPSLNPTGGVATDAQGNVYYADPRNNVIWKLPAAAPPPGESATPIFGYAAFVNAASLLTFEAQFSSPLLPLFQVYGAAPGEMVRIRGVCLGPFDALQANFDSAGMLPRALGGVSVLFDQTAAPIVSVQSGEVWAVVPSTIGGASASKVTLQFNGGSANPLTIQVLAAEPGIFTADGSGSGQAAALNQDNTPNSPANPAARGEILAFWATGQGATNPPVVDGATAPVSPLSQAALPVVVTIGGQQAEVLAAALAPDFAGAMQVNVRVPVQIQNGIVALTLSVGGVSHNLPASGNPYNGVQSVTIAVK
jgi:uncharacterized protein (TIGR03437 family)